METLKGFFKLMPTPLNGHVSVVIKLDNVLMIGGMEKCDKAERRYSGCQIKYRIFTIGVIVVKLIPTGRETEFITEREELVQAWMEN